MKKIIILSAFSFLFLLVGASPALASTAPSAPIALTPTPGNTQVGLTWTAPADGGSAITDYKVEYQASNGVIYVANADDDTILKSTDGGTTWTDTTNGGAFGNPTSITTDSSNTIYVTNGNNTILKSTDGGTTWTDTTNGGAFSGSIGITTDSLNNIYVANFYNNTILKSTDGGASWTDITNSGAFNGPLGITTDSSNTIYVTNNNNTILKSTNGGASWTNTTNGGAFSYPNGITTDSSNTIYVANANNNTILKSINGGASWTNTTNGGAFSGPVGMAVSKWLTFSDGTSTTASATVTGLTNGTSYDFRIKAVNAVGTSSPSGVASSTPVAPTAPSAPTAPTPTPGNTQVGLTWTAPADGGSAITDYKVEYQASNGVIYVANYSNNTILKSTNGGTTWTDTTNGGAFSNPQAITTDSSNIIYVANDNNTILKSSNGGASWTNTTNGGAFFGPKGITTDSSNTIYVANIGNNTILKSTNGGASWTNTTNGGAFSNPIGITTDSSNTIYVANLDNTILKSTNGGASWTNTTNGGAFNTPYGITTDTSNTIYVANYGGNTILKSSNGGASWTDTTNGGAFFGPKDITTDSSNTIYVTNIGNIILKSTDGGANWTDTTNGGAFNGLYGIAASKWLTFSDGTSTTASATVTGLTNGTSYDFRIKAVNAVGIGSPSSVASSTPVAPFTVTYTAGAGGTITGTASQTINSGSDGTAITATPSSGYRFVSWSDASTNAARTDINITADHTYTASFELIPVSSGGGGGGGGGRRTVFFTPQPVINNQPSVEPKSNNVQVNITGLPKDFQFKKDLKPKVTNNDIKILQVFLNANGFIVAEFGAGSKGQESNFFGTKTKQALMKFQQAHAKDILTPQDLKGPTGILGPYSRKVINTWIAGAQQ